MAAAWKGPFEMPLGIPAELDEPTVLVVSYQDMGGWYVAGIVTGEPNLERAALLAAEHDAALDGRPLCVTQIGAEHSVRVRASRYAVPEPTPPVEVTLEPIDTPSGT